MLAPNLDRIFKARRSHKSYARAFALQQSVRPDRCAVEDGDVPALRSDLPDGVRDRLRRVRRSGKDFEDPQSRVFKPNAVRKGAAAIDCDAKRSGCSGMGPVVSRQCFARVPTPQFYTRARCNCMTSLYTLTGREIPENLDPLWAGVPAVVLRRAVSPELCSGA